MVSHSPSIDRGAPRSGLVAAARHSRAASLTIRFQSGTGGHRLPGGGATANRYASVWSRTRFSPVAVDVVSPTRPRYAYADNLKVLLVCGVIVGHVTIAWTGVGVWVFDEPHVREPLFSILVLVAVIGALFAIPLFFLVAGSFTPASLARKGPRRFLVDRLVRLGLPMVFFVIFLSPIIEYVNPDSAGWDRGFGALRVAHLVASRSGPDLVSGCPARVLDRLCGGANHQAARVHVCDEAA